MITSGEVLVTAEPQSGEGGRQTMALGAGEYFGEQPAFGQPTAYSAVADGPVITSSKSDMGLLRAAVPELFLQVKAAPRLGLFGVVDHQRQREFGRALFEARRSYQTYLRR